MRRSPLGRLANLAQFAIRVLPRLNDPDAWIQLPQQFDHPANAEKLTDCNPVNGGPHKLDGSCTVINNVSESFYQSNEGYAENSTKYIWRYHEIVDGPTAGRVYFKKAQLWQALKPTTAPGAMVDGAVVPNRWWGAVHHLPSVGVGGEPEPTKPPEAVPGPTFTPRGEPRARPAPRTKRLRYRSEEKRKGTAQRGYMMAAKVYDGVDEAAQVIDILWDSLDKKCRGPKQSGLQNRIQKAMDIAKCAHTMNLSTMVRDLVLNQLEDAVIGKLHAGVSKHSRPHFGIGSAGRGPAI